MENLNEMMKKTTLEQIEKFAISTVKSADEIITLAKKSGVELSAEKAKELFTKIHSFRELSDEELDNVAGGMARTTTVSADASTMTVVTALK